MIAENVMYAKTHEWVLVEGNQATLGISDHAQEALGDITFIELPQKGAKVAAGESLGVVESVKAASDIYSPVDATVIEVNESLEDDPEIINQDPYKKGWICKIELSDPSQVEKLLNPQSYAEHLSQL